MYTVDDVEAAGGYDVLYSDAPFGFNNKGVNGAAEKHYRTLSVKELMALPVRRLGAPDSLHFMWAPYAFIVEKHQAHDVMKAWGYEPKTVAFVWVKRTAGGGDHVGTGFYTRANTEVCIVGTRGRGRDLIVDRGVRQLLDEVAADEVAADDTAALEPEVFASVVGRHSAKPAELRSRVERLVGPGRTMLEVFARERAANWDCVGDEVPGGADVSLVVTSRQMTIPAVAAGGR